MLDPMTLSALDWWAEAGVDTLVDEAPRNWLAPAAAASPPAPVAAAPAAPAALPADLAAFRAFLLADAAVPGPVAGRIDATGDPAIGTMLVPDMPERGDRASGRLLSGEAGALFDRMLAAMKLGRDAVYLAPFSPARPASGRLEAGEIEALARLMRHHLALVAPRRLLLMGDAPARALIGIPLAEAQGKVHSLTIGDAAVPVVAIVHPRTLDRQPEHKRAAWADLQRFMAL